MKRIKEIITASNCHLVDRAGQGCLSCPLPECVDTPFAGDPFACCPIDGHRAGWQQLARPLALLMELIEEHGPVTMPEAHRATGVPVCSIRRWWQDGRVKTEKRGKNRFIIGVEYGS